MADHYIVLARKWRPRTFAELIGQEAIGQTLLNALKYQRIAHAYLFTGARGVGKTSAARILAMSLRCENLVEFHPCGGCSSCEEIAGGRSVDVLEIDGASHTGVDSIREIRDNVHYVPSRGKYKIYIIDEVHMLSTSAFNALLKTLEEPPAHVIFIFATTEPHKIPVTVHSRCQRFDFKRIPASKIEQHLQRLIAEEGIAIDPRGLFLIVRKAEGSMRDALSLLDQVASYAGRTISEQHVVEVLGVVDRGLLMKMVQGLLAKDLQGVLTGIAQLHESGCDLKQFSNDLLEMFRHLAVLQVMVHRDPERWREKAAEMQFSNEDLDLLEEFIRGVSQEEVQKFFSGILVAMEQMNRTSFPRFVLEMALARLLLLPSSARVEEILARLSLTEDEKQTLPSTAPLLREERVPMKPAQEKESGAAATSQYREAEGPSPLPEGEGKGSTPQSGTFGGPRCEGQTPQVFEKLPDIESQWPQFILFLRREKPLLASIVEETVVIQFFPDGVHLGCRPDSFSQKYLEDAEHREQVRSFLQTFLERKVRLVIAPIKEGVEESGISEERLRKSAEEHTLIQQAKKVFQADLTAVKIHREVK
ncbi:MAG: DNA polymerase III subunit gamma/tau [Deltaproteobacteria bacterium]|nr:DNA polymerase III subunit gamma/tau [Deltaproteobacteria bacterium]